MSGISITEVKRLHDTVNVYFAALIDLDTDFAGTVLVLEPGSGLIIRELKLHMVTESVGALAGETADFWIGSVGATNTPLKLTPRIDSSNVTNLTTLAWDVWKSYYGLPLPGAFAGPNTDGGPTDMINLILDEGHKSLNFSVHPTGGSFAARPMEFMGHLTLRVDYAGSFAGSAQAM